ncbi:glucosyltransferase domain-containing protein [Eisenbergiella tayi]|uniref:glucosyltransferase domain-containing protein n=1 Tax=Eisenbergiella tayi TaxID=1432052 RepID=UPI000848F742|nr:glucosyltransferase domain-containing protein [Eisenbergiella tayi]ODR36002.1 hypothetical protein BEI60_15320 [Eisenbergiella tayi]
MKIKILNPEEKILKWEGWWDNSKRYCLIFTFIAGLIIHLSELIYQIGGIDTILFGVHQKNFDWEVSLGRWMIPLIASIRNGIVVPVFTSVVSLILMAMCMVFIIDILDINNKVWISICAIIFMSVPYMHYIVQLFYCSDAYSFSLLFSVVAVWLLIKFKSIFVYVVSALLFMLSLAIYQSQISVSIVLCLIYIFIMTIKDEKNLKEIMAQMSKFICTGIGGVLCYLVSARVAAGFFNLELAGYKGINSMGMPSNMDFFASLRRLIVYLMKTYVLNSDLSKGDFWGIFDAKINILVILVVALLIIYLVIKNRIYKSKKRMSFLVFILLLFPVAFGIITFMVVEEEYLSRTSPQVAMLYFFMFTLMSIVGNTDSLCIKLSKWLGVFVAVLICYNFVFTTNQYYYGVNWINEKTYGIASRMVDRAEQTPGWYAEMPMLIVGDSRSKNYGILDESINGTNTEMFTFYVNDGSWQKYLWQYFGVKYSQCTDSQYQKIKDSDELKEMDYFPEKNSVKIIDGVLVIKLS